MLVFAAPLLRLHRQLRANAAQVGHLPRTCRQRCQGGVVGGGGGGGGGVCVCVMGGGGSACDLDVCGVPGSEMCRYDNVRVLQNVADPTCRPRELTTDRHWECFRHQ